MSRSRLVLGFVVGLVLVASGAARPLFGWPQFGGALAATRTSPALVTGLAIGWRLAGVRRAFLWVLTGAAGGVAG